MGRKVMSPKRVNSFCESADIFKYLWWDNNSGYFIRMEPGNYSVADENGEKPYVFVPVSKFRSDLGISADKIRAGYNIAGVQGIRE